MITKSRVRDTRKPITSRSALDQAAKTRDTLQTAQAILRASSGDEITNEVAAMTIQREINRLTAEIRAYYERDKAARA